MSIPISTLDLFRSHWADRLDGADTCVIKEPAPGGGVFDPDTGLITPGFTVVYDGACLVRPAAAGEATFGEARVATFEYTVIVPWNAETVDPPGIRPGQLIDVRSATDPELDGIQLVIDNVSRDTYVTKRQLACTEAPQDAG
jgi:hypothetical protein